MLEALKRYLNQSSTLAIGLGLAFFAMVIWSMCFVTIQPYEYGIKQVNIGLSRGIQDKVYGPGLHFVVPFGFEEMHRFPKKLQVFDLTDTPTNQRFNDSTKSAFIQTSDGFFVNVDVSILYKIEDPLTVIKTIGPGRLYLSNAIIPKSEPVLKETLGTLTTEEFYDPYKRVEKMELATLKLDEELSEKGIRVDNVLIRYFRYSDEIQNNIEEKKLKDQLVFKNQAEAKAAAEAAKLAKVIEEGEAELKIELQKGKAYVTEKNAEKDLYVRKKEASGDLLVSLAEAKKAKLKNAALQGKGSANMVGLQMAEVLQGLDVIILPSDGSGGLNPLDLDQFIQLAD